MLDKLPVGVFVPLWTSVLLCVLETVVPALVAADVPATARITGDTSDSSDAGDAEAVVAVVGTPFPPPLPVEVPELTQ